MIRFPGEPHIGAQGADAFADLGFGRGRFGGPGSDGSVQIILEIIGGHLECFGSLSRSQE